MIKYLVIAICLMACDVPNQAEVNNVPLHPKIVYYKDTRTNICFAGNNLEYRDAIFTTVPCSPEVERMIRPFPSIFMTDK